jgi:formylglycine-generating enzyme
VRFRIASIGVASTIAAVAAACGSFAANDEVAPAADGGGSDDGSSGASDGGAVGARCPEGRGPSMVLVADRFCIDSTEVTQQQYVEFTQSTGGETSGQPPECAWNTSFGAGCGFSPAQKPNHPVEAVDWCDALAFCRWAGKRLCGASDGSGTQRGDVIRETAKNAWYATCTGGGALTYAYGDSYDGGVCNGADFDAGEARPVGTLPGCEGGYRGVFDLLGNALEWVDFCDPGDAGPDTDRCYIMGGSYGQGKDALRCGYAQAYQRSFKYCEIGFRCCADPL